MSDCVAILAGASRCQQPTRPVWVSLRIGITIRSYEFGHGLAYSDLFMRERFDNIPDVGDGLTREERVVLYVLNETQQERGDRNVPTAMLWGRVCEHFYISPEDLSIMLARLGARK